jgi:hypothetical protein
VESIAISLPCPRAPAARHKRVTHHAFIRDCPDGFHASGHAHSVLAHGAHARRHTPATRSYVATESITSSFRSRCSGRGITSWRSAANAPNEYQNAVTILGAFGSCNGGLDQPPVRLVSAGVNPIYLAPAHRSPASRAGAWRIPVESIAISPPCSRALAARHRRVTHNAFIRDCPDGFHASGPAHSGLAHHAHARRYTPATAILLATQPSFHLSGRAAWGVG